jgi:hypothetical protein
VQKIKRLLTVNAYTKDLDSPSINKYIKPFLPKNEHGDILKEDILNGIQNFDKSGGAYDKFNKSKDMNEKLIEKQDKFI